MNLAEIRRKAQAAAQAAQVRAPQPEAPVAPAPVAPAPVATAAPAPVATAAPAPVATVAPAPVPAPAQEPAPIAQAPAAQAPAAQAPAAQVSSAPAHQPPSEEPAEVQAAPAQAPAPETAATPAPPVEAPAPPAEPPASPVEAPAASAQPSPPQWQPPAPVVQERGWLEEFGDEPGTDLAPAWEEPQELAALAEWERTPGFDPATVILRGRESASSEEVVREAEQAEASLELLCFKVANEEYALSIMDIKEIIRPREVTEVPRVPPFVRGILSLRGIIIPVFDMRLRLGLPAAQRSERERIIVVKRQGGFCGVLVDQVVQVVRIPEAGVEAPPVVLEGIDREFIQGIGRVAGRMLILLDMEKVLDVGLL